MLVPSVAVECNKIQWNPVNTDTKGTCKNVRIIGVSVLSGFPDKKKVTDKCSIDDGIFYGNKTFPLYCNKFLL